MTGRDGLSPEERLAAALHSAEIEMPFSPPVCTLYQALRNWNEKQAQRGEPGVADAAALAATLALSLETAGWCLHDLQDGSVRAFVFSDLEAILSQSADPE
ncbi:MAG: hypothetical protein AAFY97_05185 [Pseudomonadota bacterium]